MQASSPRFNFLPPTFVCAISGALYNNGEHQNKPGFHFSASDYDGDELLYEIVSANSVEGPVADNTDYPFRGTWPSAIPPTTVDGTLFSTGDRLFPTMPYTNLAYPYNVNIATFKPVIYTSFTGSGLISAEYPLGIVGNTSGLFLNSLTGFTQFAPAVPAHMVANIRVREFRNITVAGVVKRAFLGQINTDYQFLVRSCPLPPFSSVYAGPSAENLSANNLRYQLNPTILGVSSTGIWNAYGSGVFSNGTQTSTILNDTFELPTIPEPSAVLKLTATNTGNCATPTSDTLRISSAPNTPCLFDSFSISTLSGGLAVSSLSASQIPFSSQWWTGNLSGSLVSIAGANTNTYLTTIAGWYYANVELPGCGSTFLGYFLPPTLVCSAPAVLIEKYNGALYLATLEKILPPIPASLTGITWLFNGIEEPSETNIYHSDSLKIGTYGIKISTSNCGDYFPPTFVNSVVGCNQFTTYKPSISLVGTNLEVLNPYSGASYQWKFNGNNEVGQNTYLHTSTVQVGNYQIVASVLGCSFANSDNYIITNVFVTVPGCPLLAKPTIARIGNNLGMAASNAITSYQWLYNGSSETGQTSYLHTSALQEGSYQIRVSNYCGSSATSDSRYIMPVIQVVTLTSEEVVTVSGCPTLVNDPLNHQIKLYPNPTNGLVYLDAENTALGRLKVYNGIGSLVYNQPYQSVINLSNQAWGIYLAKVYDAEGLLLKTFRLVME